MLNIQFLLITHLIKNSRDLSKVLPSTTAFIQITFNTFQHPCLTFYDLHVNSGISEHVYKLIIYTANTFLVFFPLSLKESYCFQYVPYYFSKPFLATLYYEYCIGKKCPGNDNKVIKLTEEQSAVFTDYYSETRDHL